MDRVNVCTCVMWSILCAQVYTHRHWTDVCTCTLNSLWATEKAVRTWPLNARCWCDRMSILLQVWMAFNRSEEEKDFLDKMLAGSQRGKDQGVWGKLQIIGCARSGLWCGINLGWQTRAQNAGEIECQAKAFLLYSSNNGDPGKSFEKENYTFRFVW